MNKRPSPPPPLHRGVTTVQALRAFRSVDLPSSWGGPAGNKRPSPPPPLRRGATAVQALRAFRFVDLPSSWGGPAGTAE